MDVNEEVIEENEVVDENESGNDHHEDENDAENSDFENEENENEDADETDEAEEIEEIEFDGKKYQVPAELKDAFLRQADYTRKTQEVAEQRKQAEQYFANLQEKEQIIARNIEQISAIKQIDAQLQQIQQVDLIALSEQDPARAQQVYLYQQQLKDARNEQFRILQQSEAERLERNNQSYEKELVENYKILERDIPNWSPELAAKLADFGVNSLGFTAEEISQVSDARLIKLLYKAYNNDQMLSRAKRKKTEKQTIKPVSKVSKAKSSVSKLNDKSSIDAWMKARNKQTRR